MSPNFCFIDEVPPGRGASSGGNRAAAIWEAAVLLAQSSVFLAPDAERKACAEGAREVLSAPGSVIWACRPSSLSLAFALRQQTGARLIYDTVDNHRRRLFGSLRTRGSMSGSESAAIVEESRGLSDADLVVLIAEGDFKADDLRSTRRASVLGNPWHAWHRWPTRKAIASLGFVGNFEHEPNVDAVYWLDHELIPACEALGASLRCLVAGRGSRKLRLRNCQVWGEAPDLRDFYGDVDVAVAPLRYGAGLKGKVAEAYAYGRPILGTPESAHGYAAPRDWLTLFESPSEFVAGLQQLAGARVRDDLVTIGRSVLEEQLGGSFPKRLSQVLRCLDDGPPENSLGDWHD